MMIFQRTMFSADLHRFDVCMFRPRKFYKREENPVIAIKRGNDVYVSLSLAIHINWRNGFSGHSRRYLTFPDRLFLNIKSQIRAANHFPDVVRSV